MGLGSPFEFRVSREGLLWTWFFWHEGGCTSMYVSDSGSGGIALCPCDQGCYLGMYLCGYIPVKFMSWSLRLGFLWWEILEEASMYVCMLSSLSSFLLLKKKERK
ncbi:hypothetical protein BDV38DRAFT_247386 [Aspergillus pseudotamarii]|uniref:Uncharacterized protein n=1 Tax=Aspergillus pseudotamarii TaxID=132259 RepID=A0A5N6SUW0_ASPPS|nr:uncharacterized protein BDV38DRAFT_247386 [Aspergillus pseudotamarii]KAE8137173.1 hypothetical protein BDV38DRAFT_247386 [Aspergillus pseudotamarii]